MSISEKTKVSFMTTVMALTIPIMILNLVGGITSGIWLAVLGLWGELFRGILLMVVSSFLISVALLPPLLLIVPVTKAIEKGRKNLSMFLGSISILYTSGLMTAWCLWIIWLFTNSATNSSIIPLLIWSYGVALMPWIWLS